jgi:hypothetical protein
MAEFFSPLGEMPRSGRGGMFSEHKSPWRRCRSAAEGFYLFTQKFSPLYTADYHPYKKYFKK